MLTLKKVVSQNQKVMRLGVYIVAQANFLPLHGANLLPSPLKSQTTLWRVLNCQLIAEISFVVLANDSTLHTRTTLLVPPSGALTADDMSVNEADPGDPGDRYAPSNFRGARAKT